MGYVLPPKYRNRDWMQKCRFRLSNGFSNAENTAFVKTFPVWKCSDNITLEARAIVVLETGAVRIDVFDMGFHEKYAPYYLKPSFHDEILDKVEERIEAELMRCGMIKEDEDAVH